MTPLERGLACAARLEGKSIEYISAALYRDPKTLQMLFRRRGIVGSCLGGKPRLDPPAKARIRELRKDGATIGELVARYDVSRATILRALDVNP